MVSGLFTRLFPKHSLLPPHRADCFAVCPFPSPPFLYPPLLLFFLALASLLAVPLMHPSLSYR